jgi:phospholipid-transporting ATPase
VVRVKNRSVVPADIVLLRTSSRMGGCYIETASLDGEKNLKAKMGVNDLIKHVNGLENLDE